MKNKKLKDFKSLKNFKLEIEETSTLINALEAQVIATRQLMAFIKAESSPEYKQYKKYLEISDDQIKKTYELGFIALFANFECFMFEFLKELLNKYPSSFKSEKILKFDDIKDFEKISEIKEYLIDAYAIEKSYEIETWTNFLMQKFKIKVFKSAKDLSRFKALNSLRNIILHSGSRTNSKFRNEMRLFLKMPVPLGEKFSLDRREYFGVLFMTLTHLIANLEKS